MIQFANLAQINKLSALSDWILQAHVTCVWYSIISQC